jgi:hypothetical protein
MTAADAVVVVLLAVYAVGIVVFGVCSAMFRNRIVSEIQPVLAAWKPSRVSAIVGLSVLSAFPGCVRQEAPPRAIATETTCMGGVCQIFALGPIVGSDERVRREVMELLRRKSRMALVVLKMAESRSDFDAVFGGYYVEVGPGTGPMPHLRRAYDAASQKAAVMAYVRNGLNVIWRWDPRGRERRRILGADSSDRSQAGHRRFDVLNVGLEPSVKGIHMHILMPSMVDLAVKTVEVRREFGIPDDVHLSVKYLGQARIFDERFPVQNPLFGDLPLDFREFRRDVAYWCNSPPESANLPITCRDW